jgi:heparin/heparan-sulfate lyase
MLLAGGAAWPDAASAQTVVAGHPRLYLRPADLPALRTRVTQPPASTYYNQLKSRLDGTAARHTQDEVSGFELESLALLHAVNGGTVYRDKILNTWRRTSYAPGQISHWALPYQVMAHSLALDYLWNDVSAGQRAELATVIVAMMDDLYNYSPHNQSGANPMSDYSNQLYYHLGALAFAGGVLAGEGLNDARASFYLSEAAMLLGSSHMLAATNQEAGGDADMSRTSGFTGNGGWGEDMDHLDLTHPLFGRMLEAWRTSTGQDLFPRSNGLAKWAQYITYLRRPNGYLSPKANGHYTKLPTDKGYGTLGCLVSARYNDPLGIYIKNAAYTAGTTYGFHQLGAVLWCNGSLPAANLAALPKTMHFQGQGEVVMRSGFGAQDTWVYLRSGPIYNGHQHDDQGNLLVDAYGGELLVEMNGGDVHHETIFHNSIRVNGQDQIPYGNNAVQHATAIAGTPYERGKVTAVQTTAQYTYVATDFSAAYPDAAVAAPKAGKVTREVVTVMPGVIVVRDRVTAGGALDVNFHAWAGAGAIDGTGRGYTITRGSGRAFVSALLPAAAAVSRTTQEATDLFTTRATGSASAATDFVHVISLAPASSGYVPVVSAIDTASEVGATVRDQAGQQWTVRFARSGVGLVAVSNGSGSSAPAAPTGVRIVP